MPRAETFRGSREELRQALRLLPAVLAGETPDTLNVSRGIKLRLAVAFLSQVQQAFLVKARGGRDEAGIRWQPLSPATVARRRLGPGDRKLITDKARTAHLTGAQRRTFRREYLKRLRANVAAGVQRADAAARARAGAYGVLRSRGVTVPSKAQILGARSVEILRDTGELFRSLTPGVEDRPARTPGQVVEADRPGSVTVGTNKKGWHHRGNPRLPSRPYWPLDGDLPAAWWRALSGAMQRGLAVAVARLTARRG